MNQIRKIDVVEHAKIIKQALRERFNTVKFKVISSRFPDGTAVLVYHIGGDDAFHSQREEIEKCIKKVSGFGSNFLDAKNPVKHFEWRGEKLISYSICIYKGRANLYGEQ